MTGPASACVGGQFASDLTDVKHDAAELTSGRWVVALPFAGAPVLARFDDWKPESVGPEGAWRGPSVNSWASSVDAATYVHDVERVREAIAAGDVYQANLCRVMSAPMPDPDSSDIRGLHSLLAAGNPSPFSGYVHLPEQGVALACASPELFVSVEVDDEGRSITSGPIKGTGRVESDLSDKDRAENVMIVDLVRNDISRVSLPGTVTVPALLRVEEHPGLVHLVSTVAGRLRQEVGWTDLLEATFPPGSVTGAPKSSAVRLIAALEPVQREFYCGAFGWIDVDTGEAELAVSIRTFWLRDGVLRFGTGAGITWSSDPLAEWQETELKAAHLIDVASGSCSAPTAMES